MKESPQNPIEDLKRRLSERERHERRAEEKIFKEDPSRRERRNAKRREEMERIHELTHGAFRCPRCRRGPLLRRRQWVVRKDEDIVCLSCWNETNHPCKQLIDRPRPTPSLIYHLTMNRDDQDELRIFRVEAFASVALKPARLYEYRVLLGFSQNSLADRAGLTRAQIRHIEGRGDAKEKVHLHYDVALKLIEALIGAADTIRDLPRDRQAQVTTALQVLLRDRNDLIDNADLFGINLLPDLRPADLRPTLDAETDE